MSTVARATRSPPCAASRTRRTVTPAKSTAHPCWRRVASARASPAQPPHGCLPTPVARRGFASFVLRAYPHRSITCRANACCPAAFLLRTAAGAVGAGCAAGPWLGAVLEGAAEGDPEGDPASADGPALHPLSSTPAVSVTARAGRRARGMPEATTRSSAARRAWLVA